MGSLLNRFSNLKVRSKLNLFTIIIIISLMIMAIFTTVFFKISKSLTVIINLERVYIENFEDGIQMFYKYEISGNSDDLENSILLLTNANKITYTFAKMDSITSSMPRKEWINYLYEVLEVGFHSDIKLAKLTGDGVNIFSKIEKKRYNSITTDAIDAFLIGENIISLIKDYSENKTSDKYLALQSEFDSIHILTKSFAAKIFSLNKYIFKMLGYLLALLVVVLASISALLAIRISKSISTPINKLSDNFKKIAVGNLNSQVNIDSQNEIGDLSKAFSKIQVGLLDIVSYSKKLTKGEFSNKLEPKSEEDELTLALNQMASKLEEIKVKADHENWLQNGINELNDKMNGNATVQDLSNDIINYLSNFLGFEIGAIYVFDEELKHLELTGSIGLIVKDLQKIILPGEGLIGKAAMQKSLQVLDTKDKYHKVFSASGEMNPEKIYFLPLHYNKQIQAVIEIAPLNKLSERAIEFLNLIADRISSNLNASVARFRTKELLNKTLEQSEILQAREEELSKNLAENKLMHEKLIQEKALLDSMLKTIPDYVYFKDMDSKFLRISESMVKLFDVNSAEIIIGKSDFDFHPKKDAQRYFDEEMQIIEKGEGFIDVVREGIDEHNNPLWTSVTKLPMYDETGKCLGTFGISKNVTEIKKLEIEVSSKNDKLVSNQNELENSINKLEKIQSELEQEKTLMDSLLKNLPDAIYFKDIDSKFVKVSSSMPKLFDLEKPEELYGKTDFDFYANDHALQAFNDEQQIIKSGKPIVGFIEKETLKDGSIRYVSSTKMPYYNEKGEITGTFGISRDVTKIKELELEINEQNQKLKVKQDELTLANHELSIQQEELKSINEELKSQEEELRVANEELEEQTKILTESEKNMQVQQEELRVTNEELELKSIQLEDQKKDISKKNKVLQKAQHVLEKQASELQLASQYKSEFLANMSHELRTPLNSLLILSKLLGNNKEGNLTEGQVKSANIIYKSGNDLLELINEILDLSKIEAGKMSFDFNNITTEEIKSEILQGFKPVAENKNLTLDLNQSEDFPTLIYSDKQRLLQIIKNILSNAFKFTTTGGISIHLEIPKADFKFTNPKLNSENSYLISVEDSGVGIPKDKLNAIFEAFQQADGSISRNFGGTGLGLSISKELIRILGGEIQVTSTENIGSVFILALPLDKNLVGIGYQAEEEKEEETIKKPPTFQIEKDSGNLVSKTVSVETKAPVFIPDDRDAEKNRKTILIIHPEKEKAQELLSQCHERNFLSVVAENIADGITLAKKYSPKAIIISAELNSPKEYQKLKTNSITSQIPIHHVARIEDNVLQNVEELQTPLTGEIENPSNNLENKLNTEFNQVLIVEDDFATQQAMHLLFRNKNIILHEAKTASQAYEMISTKYFDCVILDLGLPDFSGTELLKKLKNNNISIPNVIIHTARDLSKTEIRELNKYSESIVIKGVKSDERLLEEVSLFLHHIANTIPNETPAVASNFQKDLEFKGKKILLVDDDIRNIFALAQILEEKEVEILEAENGKVAIEVLKNNLDIDLVLMDIMMPVMDGYEAMEIIRKTPEIKNIPIITLTAKAMKEDYQKAIDSGANDYISKPLDVDKLFELLKIWIA